jgi:hypothetical protein
MLTFNKKVETKAPVKKVAEVKKVEAAKPVVKVEAKKEVTIKVALSDKQRLNLLERKVAALESKAVKAVAKKK